MASNGYSVGSNGEKIMNAFDNAPDLIYLQLVIARQTEQAVGIFLCDRKIVFLSAKLNPLRG